MLICSRTRKRFMADPKECPECFSTDIVIKKEKGIVVCKACGAITPLDHFR